MGAVGSYFIGTMFRTFPRVLLNCVLKISKCGLSGLSCSIFEVGICATESVDRLPTSPPLILSSFCV